MNYNGIQKTNSSYYKGHHGPRDGTGIGILDKILNELFLSFSGEQT